MNKIKWISVILWGLSANIFNISLVIAIIGGLIIGLITLPFVEDDQELRDSW